MKKFSNSVSKNKILMIGPSRSLSGGVSTVIKNLCESDLLLDSYNLELFRTGKTKESPFISLQFTTDVIDIFRFFFSLRFSGVDIFHVHTSSYWSFLRNIPYISFLKIISKGKIIVHIHGGGFYKFYLLSPFKNIIKKTLTHANCLIVTSDSWINVIKRISGHPFVFSVSNGFDDRIFKSIPQKEAREKLNIPTDKKILLTIGSLETYKGYSILFESIKRIVNKRKDVMLYLIGSGSLKESLTNSIKNNSLEDVVILTEGNKSPEEISLWINACDLFVLPSLVEGNPNVMFESLACGKPFIATSVGGIPDVINSDEYGLLCEPQDIDGLSKNILIALDKKWDQAKIVEYSKKYSWSNVSKQMIDIYEKMINGKLRNEQ